MPVNNASLLRWSLSGLGVLAVGVVLVALFSSPGMSLSQEEYKETSVAPSDKAKAVSEYEVVNGIAVPPEPDLVMKSNVTVNDKKTVPESEYFVSLVANPQHLTLRDWFTANADPQGAIITLGFPTERLENV